MPAGNSQKKRPVAFIDPPLTTMPLERWERFLAFMRELPQENEHFHELTDWAQAVVDWKIGGEWAPAPDRIKKKIGPPPQAPKAKQPT